MKNIPNQPFFNRLYVRIWLAVVFAVAVLVFMVGWAWRLSAERQSAEINLTPVVREVIVRNAAGETVGAASAQARMPGMGIEFLLQLQKPVAAGETLNLHIPRARRFNPETGQMESARPPGGGMRFGPDGRPLERPDRMGPGPYGPGGPADKSWFKPPFGFVWLLMLVGLAVALGTYPLIRRLTKRLNTLQRGVEQWGQGDLSTRVAVSGSDEVAFLAERFNIAASRIEALVGSHKSLLANASHELRSPLTRIRMGLELMDGAQSSVAIDRLKNEISRNINELDLLIAEILLASRLDSTQADVGAFEPVDLIGMAAEECSQTGAELDVQGGSSVSVLGVPKLLRRLMRNLLENANRYAKPDTKLPVELRLSLSAAGPQQTATIRVTDHGPGVPVELRERIFEPFFRAPGASERDGGVGLGLALVKSIAQRHGGTVRCELGADGKGASFVVVLPIKAA
ncbi:MAG: HAMP domain-containing sensor histidine kinase [Burkholderiaceae bacterium]